MKIQKYNDVSVNPYYVQILPLSEVKMPVGLCVREDGKCWASDEYKEVGHFYSCFDIYLSDDKEQAIEAILSTVICLVIEHHNARNYAHRVFVGCPDGRAYTLGTVGFMSNTAIFAIRMDVEKIVNPFFL